MEPRLLSLAVLLLIGGALSSANPAGFTNSAGTANSVGTVNAASLPSPDSLRWLSFRHVKESDARLVSENGAWLHALPDLRVSEARFLVNKTAPITTFNARQLHARFSRATRHPPGVSGG